MLSARITNNAPDTALPSSNVVCPPRRIKRDIWGAINPTKPMLPTHETQTAVRIMGAATRNNARRELFTPNPVAT
ncbi:hypothetical protein MUTS16_71480 [Escherichia coli]|nr:hypothetical protein MUTS16_71480 [Escherichia coli]